MSQNNDTQIAGPSTGSEPWKVLYKMSLNGNGKKIGTEKFVTLKHPASNPQFILADIRGYYNGIPSKSGVCLTSYEFDWLAQCLVHNPRAKNGLSSSKSSRSLDITPTDLGVQILQMVGESMKTIVLYKKEMKVLITKCGTFYQLLEAMDELNAAAEESDA